MNSTFPVLIAVASSAFVAGAVLVWLTVRIRSSARQVRTAQDHQRLLAERDLARQERLRAEQEMSTLRRKLEDEQAARVTAETRREDVQRQLDQMGQFVSQTREQMEGSYARLSKDALNGAIENLLQVVRPHLDGNRGEIVSTLDAKKGEIEFLLAPLREMLDKYRAELQTSESERKHVFGGLEVQIRQLLEAQEVTQRETSKLVNALRVPHIRGSWGERALKNCVELAGMSDFCDFTQQQTFDTDEGRSRPDMIIRLPGGRNIAVDSKAAIDSYREAVAESDERRQKELLDLHARNIRKHVESLSRREYQKAVEKNLGDTLDFTILFLPGEQFLSAAFTTDPALFEFAAERKVFLATPTILLPLLRAVEAGWKAEKSEENARRSLIVGQELYERFAKVFEHFEGVGRSLGSAVGKYNDAVNSINTRLMPKARELQQHVGSTREVEEFSQLPLTVAQARLVDTPRLPIQDQDRPRELPAELSVVPPEENSLPPARQIR